MSARHLVSFGFGEMGASEDSSEIRTLYVSVQRRAAYHCAIAPRPHEDIKNEKKFPKFPKKNFRIFSGFSRFEANRVKFFGINRIRACHAIIMNPTIALNGLPAAFKAENVIA